MILDAETYEAFGYYPSDLKPQSHKRILAKCDNCGKIREVSKSDYRDLCTSCVKKGNRNSKGLQNALGCKHSEESKTARSASIMGEKNHNFGKRGAESSNYKGGKKVVIARKAAKRKRQLGYTLLMPLEEGEDSHHITNEYVIGIPAEVHKSMGGRKKEHRTKVLQWLKLNDKQKYNRALCILAKESLK